MKPTEKWVGMIVPTFDNSFFSSLVCHVEKFMSEKGFQTFAASSANTADREIRLMQQMISQGAYGLISVSGLAELPENLIDDSFPLVWVDRIPKSKQPIPWVANDDAEAMEAAVDHLIERGSKSILLMPGFLAEEQESPRVAGYKRALEKHRIAFSDANVLNRSGKGSTEEETAALIRGRFSHGEPADAVITSSDRAAFGAVTALRSIGYFVPEDVRLISFDNSTYSAMSSPSITSLDRKSDLLAEKACDILEKLIRHEDTPMENVVEVALQKRDSTR